MDLMIQEFHESYNHIHVFDSVIPNVYDDKHDHDFPFINDATDGEDNTNYPLTASRPPSCCAGGRSLRDMPPIRQSMSLSRPLATQVANT